MSIKVLIIDDDQALVDLVSLKVRKWGMEPHAAISSALGMSMIEENSFDLVLLDISLGGDVSGADMLKQIREKADQNQLPVIMISASQDDKDLVYTLGNGANDFVLKPINDAILYARILTQLEHSTLSKEYAELKEIEAVKALIVTCRHEFNNPLMIAQGTLSQIRKNYEVDEKYVHRLENSLKRIEKLIVKIGLTAKSGNALEYDEYVKDVKKLKIL